MQLSPSVNQSLPLMSKYSALRRSSLQPEHQVPYPHKTSKIILIPAFTKSRREDNQFCTERCKSEFKLTSCLSRFWVSCLRLARPISETRGSPVSMCQGRHCLSSHTHGAYGVTTKMELQLFTAKWSICVPPCLWRLFVGLLSRWPNFDPRSSPYEIYGR
jgi:hypothetical protein